MNIKPEIKKLWLDALNSGEYKRANSALQDSEGKYCCLGVLCDLYDKVHGQNNWTKEDPQDDDSFDIAYMEESAYLPGQVRNWAFENIGDDDLSPYHAYTKFEDQVAEINDGSESETYEDPVKFIEDH